MSRTATIPQIGVNPLQRALEDFHLMVDRVAALDDENRVLRSSNVDLMQENQMVREENLRLRGERDRLQAFSVNITTRMSVIKETIDGVVMESRQLAIKPVIPPQPDNAAEDQAEQESARAMVAKLPERERLPVNQF